MIMHRGGRGAAVFLVALLVTACATAQSSPSLQGSTAPEGTAQASQGAASEPVTIRWMDWSDSQQDYVVAAFERYEEEHPDVTIEYTLLTIDAYQQTILSAVNAGDAPDVFPVPVGLPAQQVIDEGWFQPLDPYVDDAWKERWQNYLIEGATTFDGQVYGLPENMPRHSTLLYYNKDLFRQAGLDPEQPPTTWAELREYAQLITAAGGGDAYGIIEGGKQVNRLRELAANLASMAGAQAYPFGALGPLGANGEYIFDDPAYAGAIQLLLDMKNDGSFFPSFLSIGAPEARELFGQGKAGFLFQGDWCIAAWKANNPELDFGVAQLPAPDTGQAGYAYHAPQVMWVGMSATTEHPEEVAELIKWRYSDEFLNGLAEQGYAYAFAFVEDPSTVAGGVNAAELTQAQEVLVEGGRLAPSPQIRNPDVGSLIAELQFPQPGLGEIVQGVLAGSLTDIEAALADLNSRANADLAAGLDAAAADGASVTADDLAFPNWEPGTNYTAELYSELD